MVYVVCAKHAMSFMSHESNVTNTPTVEWTKTHDTNRQKSVGHSLFERLMECGFREAPPSLPSISSSGNDTISYQLVYIYTMNMTGSWFQIYIYIDLISFRLISAIHIRWTTNLHVFILWFLVFILWFVVLCSISIILYHYCCCYCMCIEHVAHSLMGSFS